VSVWGGGNGGSGRVFFTTGHRVQTAEASLETRRSVEVCWTRRLACSSQAETPALQCEPRRVLGKWRYGEIRSDHLESRPVEWAAMHPRRRSQRSTRGRGGRSLSELGRAVSQLPGA